MASLLGFLECGDRAERHFVIARDDADDIRVGLQHGLHLVVALGAVPVGNFLGDLLQIRILRKDSLVAIRTRCRVVVGRRAEEFGIVALVADRFDPLLRAEGGTLCVVGNKLRLG